MRRVVVWLSLAVWVEGCKRLEPVQASLGSGFPEPVARILVRRCAGCHASSSAPTESPHGHNSEPSLPSFQLPKGPNLSRWDSLLYGWQGEYPLVVPGSPTWSQLLWVVNRDSTLGPTSSFLMPPPMPDSSNLLTPEEVATLRSWIEQGAPNAQGQRPWAEMLTTPRRKVFVCAAGSDIVAVLHADTYHQIAHIPVGIYPTAVESPHYVQLSPDGRFLYVTLISGAAIEKYRTDTYEKVGRLEVGPDPAHIEFSPDGRHAIITHFTTTAPVKLSLIDAERIAILDELRDPTGQIIARPHGLWITPDFRYAYVTANSGNYLTKVEIAPDRSRFVDFSQIPLAPGMLPQPDTRWGPYQILAEPSGRYYFVSCDAANEVRVFTQQGDSLVAVIPTAAAPKLMAYHEGLLYVACLKAAAPALQGSKLGAIAVIDVQNLRLLTHIYNTGHLPRGIAIDPVRRQLFLSFENLAGTDPPHHYSGGLPGAPGKVYALQIPTFTPLAVREIPLVGYGATVSP